VCLGISVFFICLYLCLALCGFPKPCFIWARYIMYFWPPYTICMHKSWPPVSCAAHALNPLPYQPSLACVCVNTSAELLIIVTSTTPSRREKINLFMSAALTFLRQYAMPSLRPAKLGLSSACLSKANVYTPQVDKHTIPLINTAYQICVRVRLIFWVVTSRASYSEGNSLDPNRYRSPRCVIILPPTAKLSLRYYVTVGDILNTCLSIAFTDIIVISADTVSDIKWSEYQ